jgi:hypothetical protein
VQPPDHGVPGRLVGRRQFVHPQPGGLARRHHDRETRDEPLPDVLLGQAALLEEGRRRAKRPTAPQAAKTPRNCPVKRAGPLGDTTALRGTVSARWMRTTNFHGRSRPFGSDPRPARPFYAARNCTRPANRTMVDSSASPRGHHSSGHLARTISPVSGPIVAYGIFIASRAGLPPASASARRSAPPPPGGPPTRRCGNGRTLSASGAR